jgi:hypothetical protein
MTGRWWRNLSIAVRCWWLAFLVGRLARTASKKKMVLPKTDHLWKVK